MSVSCDTFFVCERFKDGLAEDYTKVFDGVVRVNFEVSFCFYIQVDFAVLAQVAQHVVDESDAGFDIEFSFSIEIQLEVDVGFFCFSFYAGDSFFHKGIPYIILFNAAMSFSFCCFVPTVILSLSSNLGKSKYLT